MSSVVNLYEDLSGVTSSSSDPNPYNALIEACDNDPIKIQERYALHRNTRFANQRAHLLSESFESVNPDLILRSILDEAARQDDEKTGYLDPRNCLVLWARPPERVRALVERIQSLLRDVVPNMWFLPPSNLHMTVLEIVHSLTPDDLNAYTSDFNPMIEEATDYVHTASKAGKFASLEKPMVMFDASAMALSFLPSVPKGIGARAKPSIETQAFTYHHLRRDLWDLCSSTSNLNSDVAENGCKPKGVAVASRYVVPTMHLTIGRFVGHADTSLPTEPTLRNGETKAPQVDCEKVKLIVDKIEEINNWLEKEYGGELGGRNDEIIADDTVKKTEEMNSAGAGLWTIGEEVGLDCQRGRLWYGEGERIGVGKSIDT